MDEEYKYQSEEVTTQEDADYDALYLGNQNAYILMNALDRIEKLEKENETIKKILIMLISISNKELKNFDFENKEMLDKLLGQLIL